jgi:hypothetical protein
MPPSDEMVEGWIAVHELGRQTHHLLTNIPRQWSPQRTPIRYCETKPIPVPGIGAIMHCHLAQGRCTWGSRSCAINATDS